MECEICNRKTTLNWGNSQHVLCKNHAHSLSNLNSIETPTSNKNIVNKNTSGKIHNRIIFILYFISLFPWLIASIMSLMVFDSPGSENSVFAWLIVGLVWSYPVWSGIFCLVLTSRPSKNE